MDQPPSIKKQRLQIMRAKREEKRRERMRLCKQATFAMRLVLINHFCYCPDTGRFLEIHRAPGAPTEDGMQYREAIQKIIELDNYITGLNGTALHICPKLLPLTGVEEANAVIRMSAVVNKSFYKEQAKTKHNLRVCRHNMKAGILLRSLNPEISYIRACRSYHVNIYELGRLLKMQKTIISVVNANVKFLSFALSEFGKFVEELGLDVEDAYEINFAWYTFMVDFQKDPVMIELGDALNCIGAQCGN